MSERDLEIQDSEDVRALLESPGGARFFCRLLDFCKVDQLSYAPEEGDVNAALFREGMRNVGLLLKGCVREAKGGEVAIINAREERRGIYERS